MAVGTCAQRRAHRQPVEPGQAEVEQQLQLEAAKAEAKAVSDDRARTLELISDIVKQAVSGAMTEKAASKPKKLRYSYDDQGLIEGAEAVD
jgi:hypothetical protein